MKNRNKKTPHQHQLTSAILEDGTPVEMSDPSQLENSNLLYYISRFEIENCLTDRIVNDLRIAPDNPLCSCPMDGIIFSVEGYDDDPREMFQIPEFRDFIRDLSKYEIPWFYFACLESRWFHLMALCLVPNAAAIADSNRARIRTAISTDGLCDFLLSQIEPFAAICQMLGISQEEKEVRIEDISRSFGSGWNK